MYANNTRMKTNDEIDRGQENKEVIAGKEKKEEKKKSKG